MIDVNNCTYRYLPERDEIHCLYKKCALMLTVTLFIAKHRKQSKCPSGDEWDPHWIYLSDGITEWDTVESVPWNCPVGVDSAVNVNRTLTHTRARGFSKGVVWVKGTSLSRLHTLWFSFYAILERHNYRHGEQISGCQGTGTGWGITRERSCGDRFPSSWTGSKQVLKLMTVYTFLLKPILLYGNLKRNKIKQEHQPTNFLKKYERIERERAKSSSPE